MFRNKTTELLINVRLHFALKKINLFNVLELREKELH